ncbi:hypothetical protein LJR168_002807 [Pseudoxanthomonas sp. LjRoot168]|uniref:hypothetical protein n=1 Tax=unclassified Pseudoxanthomonas TaxID=2645906 RepID=UPI003ECC463D
MMQARYRLPDEPLPSGLSRFAVDPMWPLLALMLAGRGVGLAWFAFNSAALGSPTRTREWLYVAAALLGSALLLLFLGVAASQAWLDPRQLRYAALSLLALKITLAYMIYMLQLRPHELWTYHGGESANGLPTLVLLGLLARPLLASTELHPLLGGMLR